MGRSARVAFGPLAIDLIDGWADITDDVAPDGPWSLARQSATACGALRVSVVSCRGGARPDATASDLMVLLREFADTRSLGQPSDEVAEDAELSLAAATYRGDEDVIRVWYVSDGANFAMATYVAAVERDWAVEIADCERMVRTFRFLP